MSLMCKGGTRGWSYSHLILPILLSLLLLFENHPLCHLSAKYALLVWEDLWSYISTQIKGASMQVNPNRDCPIIFSQVLSNVFLDSKNRVRITKQLISSKLSFNPTVNYGTLWKALLLYFPLSGPRRVCMYRKKMGTWGRRESFPTLFLHTEPPEQELLMSVERRSNLCLRIFLM